MVTRKTATIVIALGAMILAGFVAISSLFGSKQIGGGAALSSSPEIKPPYFQPLKNEDTEKTQPLSRLGLGEVHSSLENLRTRIVAGDWQESQRMFADFEKAGRRMPSPQLNYPDISPILEDFYVYYKYQLARSISEQNGFQAQLALNQLLGIVGEQQARFNIRGAPPELQRINYLIHEIEIWSQSNDSEMLRMRCVSLKESWEGVRPMIIARRGGPEIADKFDDLIKRLNAALEPKSIAALIPDLYNEYKRLSDIFSS